MARNPFLDAPDANRTDVANLSHDEAAEEVGPLREAIEQYSRAYYVRGESPVADETWDRLFARLQTIEDRFDDLRDDASPTHRVGAPPVDRLSSVEHVAPMLSLHAVVERDEARSLFSTIAGKHSGSDAPFVAEPKIDGLSMEAVYEDGVIARAVTRGDGRSGDDVTRNAKTIRSLPLRLAGERSGRLSVRGEVVLQRDEFIRLNQRRVERGDDAFANPRNAAAGAIRQLDSRAVAGVPLDFVAYDILACSETSHRTHTDELDYLKEVGFSLAEQNRTIGDFDELVEYHGALLDGRDDLPIEIDGIVVKLNNLEARRSLGVRDRSPRWAFAWKFPPRKEQTRIREIAVNVGRTGKLTPVGLLDPVEIGGVTVSRVSIHNADEVERLDVRAGDLVRIERAGDVIPHVVERISERGRKRGDRFRMPGSCPACGAGIVRDGAYHRCPNELECPAQLARAIEHYGSREALDIDHLGEKTARLLVSSGLVSSLADLYTLDEAGVASLEGFARRSASQLVEAIAASREPPLDRFLYALGIPGVGRHLARVLAMEFGEIAALRRADSERLRAIAEIGDRTAAAIEGFFSGERTAASIDRLLENGVRPRSIGGRDDTLEGITVVVTGSLDGYSRDEAKAEIERRGGRATSSVSGQTDYLVVGQNPGSKVDEAREHGVRMIDEQEFRSLLAGDRP